MNRSICNLLRRHHSLKAKELARPELFVLEPLENRLLLSVGLVGAPNWIDQGPGPIDGGNNVQITNKPQAGAIEAVAVDSSNANRIFVASVDGGVWRTNNATAANPTWTPLTDQFPSLSMGSISFDPNDATHNTLWAGSGIFSNGLGDGARQIGLLETTDGGNTWSRMGQAQLTGENIESVLGTTATVAGKEVVLVAGDNNGVWRSTDGGSTFTNVFGDPGKAGLYIQFVRRPPNSWSTAHRHINDQFIWVMSGRMYIGTGSSVDKDKTVGMPKGSYIRDFANGTHYEGTKDEDLWLLVAGMGPGVPEKAD